MCLLKNLFVAVLAAALAALPATAQEGLSAQEKAERVIAAGGIFYSRETSSVMFLKPATDAQLRVIKDLPELKQVELRAPPVTEAGLAHLGQCKDLQALTIQCEKLSPKHVQAIASLKGLRKLTLSCAGLTDEVLQKLAALNNLEELHIGSAEATVKSIKIIGQLKRLRTLSLDGLELTEKDLAHLSGLENLEELSAEVAEVTDDGVKHLQELKKLRRLSLVCPAMTDASLKRLTPLQTLEHFSLEYRKLSPEALAEFQKAFPPKKPPRFVLTGETWKALYGTDVPSAVLSKLRNLRQPQDGFETEDKFVAELAQLLTKDELERFKKDIVKHAAQPQVRVTAEKMLPFADSKRAAVKPDDDELRKLLKDRYNAAWLRVRQRFEMVRAGKLFPDFESAQQLLAAALELEETPAKQQQILEEYVELARMIEEIVEAKYQAGAIDLESYQTARYHRIDAEVQLLRFKRKLNPSKPE
jgi:hypothetical protein